MKEKPAMTSISKTNENNYAIPSFCAIFIKRFKVNRILRQVNATKEKGVSAYDLFAYILGLVFTGKNLYTVLELCHEKIGFGKDAVYRYLNKGAIHWEKFILRLSCAMIPEVDKLTAEDRKTALIIDDTPYYRNRSKRVEMLSWCYDHVKHVYYKGLTLLTLGWSDGQTFIPVSFRLLASGDDKNLIEGSRVKRDGRALATKRRNDARKEKPGLVLEMLKAVIGTAAQARYVLFDSWFASPSSLLSIAELGFHVVSRVKNHENYRYSCLGENMSVNQIYKAHKKRRGRSRYLLSVSIGIRHKAFSETVPANLVFVRERADRKKWIALISTDVSLTEDEVIALYGKRWDIETFHKMIKSYLRLAKEFQTRSFDAMTAHTAIVLARYSLLSLESRENKDGRSFGELFYACCKELDDISYERALALIIEALRGWLEDRLGLEKPRLVELVDQFIASLPIYIKDRMTLSMCES
jgi:hypothetical protein